jgi:hypothetical protein
MMMMFRKRVSSLYQFRVHKFEGGVGSSTDYLPRFPSGLKQLALKIDREEVISTSTYAFDEYAEAKIDLDGKFIETSC